MRPANIEVHIEELVLHGFASGARYRISEAVEQELQRLFVEQGASTSLMQGGEIVHLSGGSINIVSPAKDEVIGAHVAHAVYGGLSR